MQNLLIDETIKLISCTDLPIADAIQMAIPINDCNVWNAIIERTDFNDLPIPVAIKIAESANNFDVRSKLVQQFVTIIPF